MVGSVILVGAGPGDPGLLTLKGRRALEEAQVVVYDALVGAPILALMPEGAEKIDVGKRAARHTVPQEGINQILLDKALEGKRVVRLKGGDPFLFGRGGEELELLEERGVPFEVVPGVTSAIAVPAYGGIPVTHRDFTSSLHIITGHARAGKPLDIDFEALVRTGGTLVFLMGVTSLSAICAGLVAAGMDPDTPASIVERGTTPMQRRVDATAATLAEKAAAERVGAPAISVFGSVCALGERFDWFDRLPLKGRRVVVTSSLHIITGHARAGKPLDIDFEALVRTGGTLVFLMGVTSLSAICAGLVAAGMDPDTPASIVERGTTPMQRRVDATAATLAEKAAAERVGAPAISVFGSVCALGERFDWFDRLPLKGRRVVVTRPRERAGTLAGRLRDLGADVVEYPCIETVPIVPCPDMARALERIGAYEWLALTSPAGVSALMDELDRQGKDARALGSVKLAAIGGGTAGELKAHGLRADYVPEVYDAEHLGAGLAERARGRVLILRAELGSPALTAALDGGKIPYDDVHTYRTVYENPRSGELRELLERGEDLLVTFTSASTVKGFVASVGENFDFSGVTGACIGVQTAGEAGKHGIRTIVAERADMDALVETVMGLGAPSRPAGI